MNFPPTHTICFTLSDLDVLVFLEAFSQLLQLRLRNENKFGNPTGRYRPQGYFKIIS